MIITDSEQLNWKPSQENKILFETQLLIDLQMLQKWIT